MDSKSEVRDGTPSSAYVQAFKKATDEYLKLQTQANELRQRLVRLDAEIDRKLMVAKTLADAMAGDGDPSLQTKLQRLRRSAPSSRTGVAYDIIRQFLVEARKSKTQITTADVLQQVKDQKIGVDPKAVYNALNYLEKTGKLKRLSRGHYLVTDGGYAVHSSQDINRLEDREIDDY